MHRAKGRKPNTTSANPRRFWRHARALLLAGVESIRSWLGQTTPAPRRTRRPVALSLEFLETRLVPSITVTGKALNFTEGVSGSGVVATFTDPGHTDPTAYSGSVQWGDSQSTTIGTGPGQATVSYNSSTGVFSVTASHTYNTEGSDTLTITVNGFGPPPPPSGSGTSTATVADAALAVTGQTPPSSTAAGSNIYWTVNFTDADAFSVLTDYTFVFDWGDGGQSGKYATSGGTGGPFSVQGTHAYAQSGTYLIRLTITDAGGSVAFAANTATITAASSWDVHVTVPTTDPTLGTSVSAGLVSAGLANGNLHKDVPLDFSQSTCNCGQDDAYTAHLPATLTYDASTTSVKPIWQVTLTSPSSGSLPSLQAQLTWNGTPQGWTSFNTTGHTLGDTYLMDLQLPGAVTTSGLYSWSVEVKATVSGSTATDQTFSGVLPVQVNTPSSGPFGYGWRLSGLDQLLTGTGGVGWVGSGGSSRYFPNGYLSNTYVSPLTDFGSLTRSGSTYTYLAKDHTQETFNSSGQLVRVQDAHGVGPTYLYSSGSISGIDEPDGAVVTFNYTGSQVTTIQVGSRTATLAYDGSNNLTAVTDPAGHTSNFSYDSNHLMQTDAEGGQTATMTYDASNGTLTGIDRGAGQTLSVGAASARGLGSTAANASQAVGTATDGLSHTTTYALDSLGRATNITTPDGAITTIALDAAGQQSTVTDPLGHKTSFTYDYAAGNGDLTKVDYADGTNQQYQYDSTFHHVTRVQDQKGNVTTNTYDPSTGDLLTATDALGHVTTNTWSGGLLQTTTDTLGHTVTYQYDSSRRLTVQIDALGNHTTYTYDSKGNQNTVTDPLGHVTTSVFDSDRRLTQQTNAAAGVTTYTYDTLGELTSVTDPLGHVTCYTYNTQGERTTVIEAYGTGQQRTTTTAYDNAGNVLSVTDPRGNVTSYAYDSLNRETQVIEAYGTGLQRTTTTAYDNAGNVLSVTDPLGHIVSYGYDSLNRRTQQIDAYGTALQRTTTTAYDNAGNVLSVTDPLGHVTSYAYDSLNQRTQLIEAYGTGLQRTTTTAYDAAGNILSVTDPLGAVTSYGYDSLNRRTKVIDAYGNTAQRTSTTVYDAAGNVVQTIDALNFTTTYAYDSLNRQVTAQTPSTGVTTTVYDADSNVVNTIDPLGHKGTFVYDALNRKTQSIDANGATTTTVYDADNNTVNVIDSDGNKTTFVFDALNRQTQQTDPLGHTATAAFDADNNLTSTTDRDGRVRNLTYDALNRQTGETWVVTGTTVNTLTFTYDAADNRLTAADAQGTYTMAYDALNRMTSQQGLFGVTLTFTYDAGDNRTQVQDSFGGTMTSVYDALHRLTSRKFGGNGQTPLRIDSTYTARDQLASEIRYSDLAGTVKVASTSFIYDAGQRLTNLQHLTGTGSNISNYTYTYDLADRVTSETLNATTTSYSYDVTNQLTNDSHATYTYDSTGNRTMTGYTTGTGNQLTGDGTWTYAYDSEGNEVNKTNLSTGEKWTYGYDTKNRLTSAVDATSTGTTLASEYFSYDVFGNRVEQDVWTQSSGTTTVTRFAYDGQNVLADLTSGNALQTRYVHGDAPDQLFARISSGGAAAWYLTDHLGSVRDMTDNTGVAQDHINYDGFGNVTSETNGSFGDRFKFQGMQFQAIISMYGTWARFYDPTTGRWTNHDPLGFSAGDSNLYRYVLNRPTNFTDPTGLLPSNPHRQSDIDVIYDPKKVLERKIEALEARYQQLESQINLLLKINRALTKLRGICSRTFRPPIDALKAEIGLKILDLTAEQASILSEKLTLEEELEKLK